MDELLRNRWAERNRELNENILRSQSEMNARGALHSNIAVKALHELFAQEFTCNRHTIVKTITDSLKQGTVTLDRKVLESWASDQLRQRQEFLDGYFNQRARVSMGAIQNQAMIRPFTNVAQYYDHAAQEITIELLVAIDDYEKALGETLYDRVLNNFKNYPAIVIGIFEVTVLLAFLGLISLILQAVN